MKNTPSGTAPMSTAPSTPQNAAPAQNMDALNNNPNGSTWLAKYDRPAASSMVAREHVHHMMTHKVKHPPSGGGGK